MISGEIITLGGLMESPPFQFLLDAAGSERVLHEAPARTGDVEFCNSQKNDVRFREVERLECPLGTKPW